MVGRSGELDIVNPDHLGLLNDTLRAPSAHNAQPWRIHPLGDEETYDIHYYQHDGLPEDHGDKDAYLTMGALVETMVLQGPNHGYTVDVEPELTRDGTDLFIARVAVREAVHGGEPDPLENWISKRVTNRSPYTKEDLPDDLEAQLGGLGNTLVNPGVLKGIVLEASMRAWGNPRYVEDLKNWFRRDPNAPDGLTAEALRLGNLGALAAEFAFRRGNFDSRLMQRVYSMSEVDSFMAAPRAAVITVPDMSPASLFDAGRRLLRSWVTVTAEGYASQPFSVAVDDQGAVPKVAAAIGTDEIPVALYRIGRPTKPNKRPSGRRSLEEVIV
jgi:hypothetical protein